MSTSAITYNPGLGFSGLTGPFSAIVKFFDTLHRAQAAAADFERLSAMSSEGLAREGLKRPEIARVVMERHFG